MQTKTLTSGVIASVITPFASNGEIDADRLSNEVTLLAQSPVDGLCVGGLLSGVAGALPEELRSLAMIARKATKKSLFAMVFPDVIVEAAEMMRAVTDGGADVVLVAQPHYLCQPGEDGLVEMFEELKKLAKVPVLLADCFSAAKVDLPTTRQLIDKRLIDGVLQGSDAHVLVDLLCVHPRVPIYCGIEDLHYLGFMLGTYGSVSDLGSVFPSELSQLYRSFKNGDHEDARLHHERLVRLWRVLSPAGERESRVRSALAAQGRQVGAARSPYNFLGADISGVIKSALQEEGLTGTRTV